MAAGDGGGDQRALTLVVRITRNKTVMRTAGRQWPTEKENTVSYSLSAPQGNSRNVRAECAMCDWRSPYAAQQRADELGRTHLWTAHNIRTQPTQPTTKDKTMSDKPTAPTAKPSNKPTAPAAKPTTARETAAAPAATTNGSAKPEPAAEKAKKAKPERVRLVSSTNPRMWCRMYKSVMDQYGAPLDPQGAPMVPGKAVAFGISPEEREARKAAKAAEKAALDAMTPEQKLEAQRAKRDAKARAAEERNKAARAELEAKIRADLLAEMQKAGWVAPAK